jgi:hypothetical protein
MKGIGGGGVAVACDEAACFSLFFSFLPTNIAGFFNSRCFDAHDAYFGDLHAFSVCLNFGL